MTTPQQPPAAQYGTPSLAAGARLPIPGNAEFAVFFIIWLATDAVTSDDWVVATSITTFGYLISRGIAKASRVLEQ